MSTVVIVLAALAAAALVWRLIAPADSTDKPDPETRLPEDDAGPDNDRGMW